MIRQFDVVDNPDPIEAVSRPYLLNLQSDLVHELTSTVVAPLVPKADMTGPVATIRSWLSRAVNSGWQRMSCLQSTAGC